jgi:hypothetical protein
VLVTNKVVFTPFDVRFAEIMNGYAIGLSSTDNHVDYKRTQQTHAWAPTAETAEPMLNDVMPSCTAE